MILEIMNDILNDLSPLYIYVGAILSVLYINRLYDHIQPNQLENQFHIRKWHDLQFRLLPSQIFIPRILEMREWLISKVKRVEAPDDDTDSHSFSKIHFKQLRGGKEWRKNLYSLTLRSIA